MTCALYKYSYTSIDSPPAQYKYIYMMNLQQNMNNTKFYDFYYKMRYIINLIIVIKSWIDFKKNENYKNYNIIWTTFTINYGIGSLLTNKYRDLI